MPGSYGADAPALAVATLPMVGSVRTVTVAGRYSGLGVVLASVAARNAKLAQSPLPSARCACLLSTPHRQVKG